MTADEERPQPARRDWVPVAYPVVLGGSSFLLVLVTSGASLFAGARMIVVAVILATLVTMAAGAVLRDRHRGGMVALTVVLLLIVGDRPALAVALGLGILLLVVERIASNRGSTRTPWPTITRVMNGVAVVIVLAITIKAAQDGTIVAYATDLQNEGPAAFRPQRPAERFDPADPDIYVVLLDGYVRDDKLRGLFGYDNGPFIGELEARGFDLSTGSRSNYLLTAASLASMLNMRHLEGETELAALRDGDVRHVREVRRLINGSEALRELRGRGYETIAMASGFEEVALRGADRFIDTGQLNEVEFLSMQTTGVGAAISVVAPQFAAAQQRARIDALFRETETVGTEPHDRPRFVFTHVPSPHAPIVFAADGSPRDTGDLATFYDDRATRKGLTKEQYGDLYAGQVAYLNGRVIHAVDAILAAAVRPTVIIVFSDHGSADGFRPDDLRNSDLDERSAILLAALTPGRDEVLGDDVSLVNVFGMLFDAYFETTHPRQPDTVYRWDGASIFNVVPVPGLAPGRSEP